MYLIVFGLIVAIIAIIIPFKIGYSYSKKNMLIHLFKEKIITSEQYGELDKTDI